MAKAIGSEDGAPAAKRAKTGGRPAPKSLDEKIEDAVRRGKLATLPDDTTVDSELAAFYLIMSMSQLREYRADELPSEEDKKDARLEKAAEAAAKAAGRPRKKPDVAEDGQPKGLRMIKLAQKGAVGSNQPVTYKMGDLRDFQKRHAGYGTFEVRLASAGLIGFVSEALPFFAAAKPDRKGRPVLLLKGWGQELPKRERLLVRAMAGEIKCVWMTPAEAIHSLWSKESEHKKFAKPWMAMLKEEIAAAKASIDRTALSAIAFEGKGAMRKSKSTRL